MRCITTVYQNVGNLPVTPQLLVYQHSGCTSE